MVKEPWYKSVFISVFLFRKASREIAEQQRKAREEAENKRIEKIMSKVRDGLLSTSEGLLFFIAFYVTARVQGHGRRLRSCIRSLSKSLSNASRGQYPGCDHVRLTSHWLSVSTFLVLLSM